MPVSYTPTTLTPAPKDAPYITRTDTKYQITFTVTGVSIVQAFCTPVIDLRPFSWYNIRVRNTGSTALSTFYVYGYNTQTVSDTWPSGANGTPTCGVLTASSVHAASSPSVNTLTAGAVSTIYQNLTPPPQAIRLGAVTASSTTNLTITFTGRYIR